MSLNLLWRTLSERKVSLGIYIVSLLGYGYLIVSFYPVFQSAAISQLLESYPEDVLAFFAGTTEFQAATSIEGFLSVEYFSLVWIVILGAFAIAFATAGVTKEVENGTIELLLAQPISRLRVILTKSAGFTVALVALILVSSLGVWLGVQAIDETIKLSGMAVLSLVGLALFLAIYAYSVFFAVIFNERGRAAFAATGLTVLLWVVNSISLLSERWRDLKYVTLFHYYNPISAMSKAEIPWTDLAVQLGTAAVFFLAALLIFRQKDIT